MASVSDTLGMGSSLASTLPAGLPIGKGEPVWDIARLFPPQGHWTEEEYLRVVDSVNCFIEFDHGMIEVLPMPTIEHQLLARFFLDVLRAFVEPRDLGAVLFGPLPTWLDDERYKEPDILFATKQRLAGSDKYFHGVDLAVEIVSDDDRSHTRDYVEKRELYAQAGVVEYWIVDPQQQRVLVLTLDGDKYAEHANMTGKGTATSKLLEGFEVDVAAVFAAGKHR